MSDDECAVRAYLTAERFPASEDEVQMLTELHPTLRAMMDGMEDIIDPAEARSMLSTPPG